MTAKSVFLVLFLVALFASGPAHAHTDSRVLTVRQLPSEEYAAVITYDRSICGSLVNSATSIEVVGSKVRIESPLLDRLPCAGPLPIPSDFIEEIANIGSLAPGNYTVSWVQPASFALTKSLLVSESSQEGPLVPCVGCDLLTQAPFPETGSWYNPDQSGSGVSMEMQNGVLVGYYFGYDLKGNALWYLFSGLLVRSTQAGVLWELDTHLQHYQGGNCLGCVYEPPKALTEGPAIRLEFLQRSNMRLTIDSNPGQFFVPIIFGSRGHSFFSAQTPYLFPEYGGGDEVASVDDLAPFVFIFRPAPDALEPYRWSSKILGIADASGPFNGQLRYTFLGITDPPIARNVVLGEIDCKLSEQSAQPGCEIFVNGKIYVMPIGQMSDSRFFGEAADGSTVEAYRLDYD